MTTKETRELSGTGTEAIKYGKALLVSTTNGEQQLTNGPIGRLVEALEASTRAVMAIALTHDVRRLLVVHDPKLLEQIDSATDSILRLLPEATVTLAFPSPEWPEIVDGLAKHHLKITGIDSDGVGDNFPEITITGSLEDMKAWNADFYGHDWDDINVEVSY